LYNNNIIDAYYYNPTKSIENQILKGLEKEREIFKSVDIIPKRFNLSENEKNYYIHVDLPRYEVKMWFINIDRTLDHFKWKKNNDRPFLMKIIQKKEWKMLINIQYQF